MPGDAGALGWCVKIPPTSHPAGSRRVGRVTDIRRPTWRLKSEVLPHLALSLSGRIQTRIPFLQTVLILTRYSQLLARTPSLLLKLRLGTKRRARPLFHHEASSSSAAINPDLSKAGLEGGVRPSIPAADIAGKKIRQLLGAQTFLWAGKFSPFLLAEHHVQAHARSFCRVPVLPMASPLSAPWQGGQMPPRSSCSFDKRERADVG